MNILDIFLIIATISIIVLLVVLVPTLLQVRKTISKTGLFMENLNQDLVPLLKSLSQTSMEMQILSTTINDKLKRTDRIIDTVQQSTNTLMVAADMLKTNIIPVVAQVSGLIAGVKAIAHFLKTTKRHN